MAAKQFFFTEEDMAVDDCLGYPKAYAKLCQDPDLNPYSRGPPSTFTPFALPSQEVSRARELDQLFPVIDREAKPSVKPKIFLSLLWKQLNHLGNAGFDPAQFRVDPYGNVLYYHADPASPLAWDIDHWFPCARGGRTVPCNLRILQLQVYKKKHNKLEFLVPWWDLQLGISVNQFLSIFASSNSDFRNRAFSLLFSQGENEELGDSQSVDSHVFPQHFIETMQKVGLAPAAIVLSRKQSSDSSSVLRSVDLNRKLWPHSATADARKFSGDENESLCKSIQMFRPSMSKENENPDSCTSPYLTNAAARDSLRQREEMQAEILKLDKELDEMNNKNEVERVALQELESTLIKRRRRAEKSRRLAEAQSSYKALLEKMIRDAMHQSVIYKEQLRLNQASSSALMARLEAQKAICDAAERDLRRKHKEREEIENQIKPHWEHARKRSRTDDLIHEERDSMSVLCLPETKPRRHLQKALRVFLEEEQKASEAGFSPKEETEREDDKLAGSNRLTDMPWEMNSRNSVQQETHLITDNLQKLDIGEFKKRMKDTASVLQSPEKEDEECRKQRGKGNVEKWLQLLLDDPKQPSDVNTPRLITEDGEKNRMDETITEDETSRTDEIIQKLNLKNPQREIRKTITEDETSRTDEIIKKLNLKNPQREIRVLKFPASEEKAGFDQNCVELKKQAVLGGNRTETVEKGASNVSLEKNDTGKGIGSCKSFQGKERKERDGKDTGLARSESARTFRPIPYSPSQSTKPFKPIPYSPSVILGMKKGVDCIGKKPQVIGSDDESDLHPGVANSIFRSSIKSIKRAVKI